MRICRISFHHMEISYSIIISKQSMPRPAHLITKNNKIKKAKFQAHVKLTPAPFLRKPSAMNRDPCTHTAYFIAHPECAAPVAPKPYSHLSLPAPSQLILPSLSSLKSTWRYKMTSAPGWTVSFPEMKDRRMMEDIAPEGKKWECCTACNGAGKVLVDDIPEVKR